MKIAVIGLGRLGAPMAAVFASSGFTVVGVDANAETVRAINEGRSPVVEEGLPEVLLNAQGNLSATTDYTEALVGADISFIVVPTPSATDGTFSLAYVLAAVKGVGAALRSTGNVRHVVVITSTVMPGSTVGPILRSLQESAGLIVGRGVGLCYSPEFIALGSVVRDLTHPDVILIGESDASAGDQLLRVLRRVTAAGTPVTRMDPTSAEVTKLAVNTFVTAKISYANMLAEICDHLPGADVSLVTAAVGMDRRIGQQYLAPGAPYGGPCFPRDNVALAALARSLGCRADLAEATEAINRRQLDRAMTLVRGTSAHGSRVAVLGLSYKPGTPVRDESFGVNLVRRCRDEDFEVIGWDPMWRWGSLAQELQSVTLSDSLEEVLGWAEVAVVATPWPELSHLPAVMRGVGRLTALIDCWRLFDEGAMPVHVRLVHDTEDLFDASAGMSASRSA